MLREHHILYTILTKESQWINYGEFDFRNYSQAEIENIFSSCFAKDCTEIKDGKWFRCVRIAHQYHMHAIPQAACEYVDLQKLNVNEVKEAIQIELSKPYLHGCQYCSGGEYGAANTIRQGVQCTGCKPYLRYEYT